MHLEETSRVVTNGEDGRKTSLAPVALPESGIDRHWREEREEAERVLRERMRVAMLGYANLSPEDRQRRMLEAGAAYFGATYRGQLGNPRGYAALGMSDVFAILFGL